MNMSKIKIAITALVLFPMQVFAENYRAVYINGIQNERRVAETTAETINILLQTPINHSSGRTFTVKNIWNPIGWYGRKDGEWDLDQDLKELFLLKTAEERYLSAFSRITLPHFNTNKTINVNDVNTVAQYADIINNLPGNNDVQDSTSFPSNAMARTHQTTQELLTAAGEGLTNNKTIIIAHSQGNLLANLVYAKILKDQPET